SAASALSSDASKLEKALSAIQDAERREPNVTGVEEHPAQSLLAMEVGSPDDFQNAFDAVDDIQNALDAVMRLREAMERAQILGGSSATRELSTWGREAAGRAERLWRELGRHPSRRHDQSDYGNFARRWLHLLGVRAVATAVRDPLQVPREQQYEGAL